MQNNFIKDLKHTTKPLKAVFCVFVFFPKFQIQRVKIAIQYNCFLTPYEVLKLILTEAYSNVHFRIFSSH